MTSDFWKGRRVFVTGHTGFKGGWLSLWLHRLGALLTGYSLSAPSKPSLFESARVASIVQSVHGDVRDADHLRRVMTDAAPEVVFHLAAQALVRQSYRDPLDTFGTNLMGTVNLLNACRDLPGLRAVIVVTSDKCYEESAASIPYSEKDPLGGHDPYSASKACAEIATAAYRHSYFPVESGVAIATARAGNVIGGGDWGPDRLLPDLVLAFSSGQLARVRNPQATRPWQHVLDPLLGYLVLAEELHNHGNDFADAWNFGPAVADATPVERLVRHAAELWGKEAQWVADPTPQPREALVLALDAGKARRRLGWQPRLSLEAALDWTVSWYRGWYQGGDARCLAEEQIVRFMGIGPS